MASFSKTKVIEFIHRYHLVGIIAMVFLAGATSLGVGIWMMIDGNTIRRAIKIMSGDGEFKKFNDLLNVGYMLLALGVVMLIMGLVGCFGAIKECTFTLFAFVAMVSVLFLASVVGILVILLFEPGHQDLLADLEPLIQKRIIELNYNAREDNRFTKDWNEVMFELECCGFESYKDFNQTDFYHDLRFLKRP